MSSSPPRRERRQSGQTPSQPPFLLLNIPEDDIDTSCRLRGRSGSFNPTIFTSSKVFFVVNM